MRKKSRNLENRVEPKKVINFSGSNTSYRGTEREFQGVGTVSEFRKKNVGKKSLLIHPERKKEKG